MTVDSFLSKEPVYGNHLSEMDDELRRNNMLTVTEHKQREVSDPCHDSAPKPPPPFIPSFIDMLKSDSGCTTTFWLLILLVVLAAVYFIYFRRT